MISFTVLNIPLKSAKLFQPECALTLFILPGGCLLLDNQATANCPLQVARLGAFPPSPTPGLSLLQPILRNSLPILFSRLPPLTATKTSTPRKTSIRAPWNALSTRERVSKVKVKATKSPSVKKTKGPTVITARKPTKTTNEYSLNKLF